MSVGWNIKEIRESKNITQKELAEKLGITQSTLSGIENRATNSTLKTLARVSGALDASLLDLMVTTDSECDGSISEVRNYKQTQWLKLFDLLNDDGIAQAGEYIRELSRKEEYQSDSIKELVKKLGEYPSLSAWLKYYAKNDLI